MKLPGRSRSEDTILVTLLFFAPLAFASVHTWAWCTLAILSLILFDIYFISRASSRLETPGRSALSQALKLPTSIAILAFLGVNLLYIVPLPANAVKMLSPEIFRLRAEYMFSAPSYQTLSVYPRATVEYLIKLASYIMVYLVVISKLRRPQTQTDENNARRTPRDGRRESYIPRSIHPAFIMFGAVCAVLSILFHAFVDFNMHIPADALYFTVLLTIIAAISHSNKNNARRNGHVQTLNYRFLNKLVNSIIIIGFIVGLFGIIQWLSWTGRMFWLVSYPGSNFGPFVCYNNFAGFMEMTSFLAIAMFYSGIFTSPLRHMRRVKDKVVWFSSPEANKTILYLFMSIVMVGSLFLSRSRGGIISFALAFIVFTVVCLAIGPRTRKAKLFITSLTVLGLFIAMIIWLGPENTIMRFKRLEYYWTRGLEAIRAREQIELLLRPYMWIDTVQLIKDFPLVGAGLGAYSNIFMIYRTFPAGWGFLFYAHQDHLHLLAELGSVGGAFFLLFLVWYLRRFSECVGRLRRGAANLEEK
jgi:hypothetical protein